MKLLIVAAISTLAVAGNQIFEELTKMGKPAPVQADLCCTSCTLPKKKYYSIDHRYNHCGESCMDPKDFWLFKIFEPGLAIDETTNTPCKDRKYPKYNSTPTHGVWPVTMTLDLYDQESVVNQI